MAWKIEFSAHADKQMDKLGRSDAVRIAKYLREVSSLDDPFSRGHGLTGKLSGLWRYRVGDWRVIARIEGDRLVILVLEVGHRREVYD